LLLDVSLELAFMLACGEDRRGNVNDVIVGQKMVRVGAGGPGEPTGD
jgi:hypothetical protein